MKGKIRNDYIYCSANGGSLQLQRLLSMLTSSANHGTQSTHSFVFLRQSLLSYPATQVTEGRPRSMWREESVCIEKYPDVIVHGGDRSGRLVIGSW